jgi:RNA polymerase sigma-70 factor, ECF subfamily
VSPEITAALVVRGRHGDSLALERLAEHFLRPAYAVALAVLRRPADAEDVAQDAVIVALARLDTCREPRRFSAWLFTIVRNRSRNWLDARKLREPGGDPEIGAPFAGEPAERRELREHLVAALGRLAPEHREVVVLHDLDGWTHPEIGEALGVSELVSRQRLFKARKVLRVALAQSYGAGETATVVARSA